MQGDKRVDAAGPPSRNRPGCRSYKRQQNHRNAGDPRIVRLDAVKLCRNEAAQRECRWDSHGEGRPRRRRTSRITSQTTEPRIAPSATRTPISFVRRATTNAATFHQILTFITIHASAISVYSTGWQSGEAKTEIASGPLEIIFQRQLKKPVIVLGARNPPKRTVAEAAVWVRKLRSIERIEGFSSKLQTLRF